MLQRVLPRTVHHDEDVLDRVISVKVLVGRGVGKVHSTNSCSGTGLGSPTLCHYVLIGLIGATRLKLSRAQSCTVFGSKFRSTTPCAKIASWRWPLNLTRPPGIIDRSTHFHQYLTCFATWSTCATDCGDQALREPHQRPGPDFG